MEYLLIFIYRFLFSDISIFFRFSTRITAPRKKRANLAGRKRRRISNIKDIKELETTPVQPISKLSKLDNEDLDVTSTEASSSCISTNDSITNVTSSLDDVVDFIYSEMENLDPETVGLPQIDIDQ